MNILDITDHATLSTYLTTRGEALNSGVLITRYIMALEEAPYSPTVKADKLAAFRRLFSPTQVSYQGNRKSRFKK